MLPKQKKLDPNPSNAQILQQLGSIAWRPAGLQSQKEQMHMPQNIPAHGTPSKLHHQHQQQRNWHIQSSKMLDYTIKLGIQIVQYNYYRRAYTKGQFIAFFSKKNYQVIIIANRLYCCTCMRARYIFYHTSLEQLRPSNKQTPRQQQKNSQLSACKNSERNICSQVFKLEVKPYKVRSFNQKIDSVPRFKSYFSGKTLKDQDDYKQYLMQSLQAKINRKIKNTLLLFAYDPFNPKANIHSYIDEQPNILLICKTTKGYHLAAYSQSAVRSANINEGSGLIISLTNRRCFQLVSGKKAVKYDKQYLIFGNSQIRVCGSEKKLFSNFGINNASYDSKRQRVGSLLGEGDSREAVLEHLEVYQIELK